MPHTVRLKLGAEVVYVFGTVNGEKTIWTRIEDDIWQTSAPLSADGMYYIDIAAYDELGRATPLQTSVYHSAGLLWRTDWAASDNYARAEYAGRLWRGVESYARLWYNYGVLRDQLNREFGGNARFSLPVLDGYATYATPKYCNAVEAALAELHMWNVAWTEKSDAWREGEPAPKNVDVNRWERNAQEIERTMPRVRAAWIYSGEQLSICGGSIYNS